MCTLGAIYKYIVYAFYYIISSRNKSLKVTSLTLSGYSNAFHGHAVFFFLVIKPVKGSAHISRVLYLQGHT